MNIVGLDKLSLLDYPDHVCCIVFTKGCNMKCPFCHNSDLVLNTEAQNTIDESFVFKFLEKRKGLIDGVCITGGEPTLQQDLKDFIVNVKELGYKVKLDTNGLYPSTLIDLIESDLLDYVAVDIKNSFDKYAMTCGVQDVDTKKIKQTIDYLMQSEIDYEFRTTVLRGYHTETDMRKLSDMLCGCKHYYLQKFRKVDSVIDSRCEELSDNEVAMYLTIVREKIPHAEARGILIEGVKP